MPSRYEFIKRSVVTGMPKAASDEQVNAAIAEASRMLSNLIHYSSGRSHYDEDLAFVARCLLAQKL